MVGRTFSGSVVARMNFTCDGGSSSVFSSALNALLESMWTSSMMYTLNRDLAGRYWAFSMIPRTLSTPVFEAASISITSMSSPREIAWQESHLRHGLVVGPSLLPQFSALANMRAMEVFPTPLVPLNR